MVRTISQPVVDVTSVDVVELWADIEHAFWCLKSRPKVDPYGVDLMAWILRAVGELHRRDVELLPSGD